MQVCRKLSIYLSLGLILTLSACVTNTRTGRTLDDAIKAGNWQVASNIYNQNENYFRANFQTLHPQLALVANELNQQLEPQLKAAGQNLSSINWPLPAIDWPYTASHIIEAEKLIATYQGHRILSLTNFRSPHLAKLKGSFDDLKDDINKNTDQDFAAFDHFGTKSFFTAYPKKLNAPRFMTNKYHLIKDDITHASLLDLDHFLTNYRLGKTLRGDVSRHVRNVYLDALSRSQTNGDDADLFESWNILQAATKKGLNTKALGRDRFLIMEVPSKSRLQESAIDFPMALNADIAFNHRQASIENVMIDSAFSRAKYVLIVDVAASSAIIEENNITKANSKYYTHSEYTRNPAFKDARQDVKRAQERLRQAQKNQQKLLKQQKKSGSSSDAEALANIFGVILSTTVNNSAVENAERALAEAEKNLQNTPRQIETKQFTSYEYSRISVKGTKEIAVNYFVVDKVSKKYVRGNLTRKTEEFFTLLKNTRSDDPNLADLAENTMDDSALQKWRQGAINIKVSEIIDDYKLRRKSASRLPANALVQQDLFDQRNHSMRRLASASVASSKQVASINTLAPKVTEIGYGRVAEYDFPKGKSQPNSFAIVVGVKNYLDRDVPRVEFALNDADAIKQFLIKTRGFLESNVIVLEDPRQSEMLSYFGTETNHQGKLYDIVTREKMDNVFVYFSGHGIPTKSGSGVMLPSDADPLKPEFTGYKLETLIQNLNKLTNVNTVLAVDSCFSGVSDGGTLIRDASPIFLSARTNRLGLDNGVVFTAADGAEIASWDREMRMGLFTRHLLEGYAGKADLNKNGKIEVFEMEKHLINAVGRDANRRFSRQQTPQTVGKADLTLNHTIDPNIQSLDEIMRLAN